MSQPTALIVGAGIGGLAAGGALRRAGWRTRIFERAATPREMGFALNLAPNAMTALRELGLADRLLRDGHVTAGVEVRHAGGRTLRRIDIGAALAGLPSVVALAGLPSVVALRPVLHGALLDAVAPDSLVLGSAGAGFETSGRGVTLLLEDGRSETGDVLIGADGLGSAIRARLHPGEPPPRPGGFRAVRGVVQGAGHVLGALSGVAYFGHRIEATTIRASQEAIYWYISLPAEDVPEGTRSPRVVVDRIGAVLDDGFRAIARATKERTFASTISVIGIRSTRGIGAASRCLAMPRIACALTRARERRRRWRMEWRSASRSRPATIRSRHSAATST